MNAQQVDAALRQIENVRQVVVLKVQFEGKDLWTVAVPEMELSACHPRLAVAYGEVRRQLTTSTVKRCSYWRAWIKRIGAAWPSARSRSSPSLPCCVHAANTNNHEGKDAHVIKTLEPAR